MNGVLAVLRPRWTRLSEILILIGLLLALWQTVHMLAGAIAMTAPLDTIRYTAKLVVSADFWPHALTTMQAFGMALLIAATAGPVLGAALGFHRLASEAAEPVLVALYSIPKVTLYPIILLLFSLGLGAEVAFGALHGIVPIMLFTMNAVRNIRPVFIKTARVLRLRPWRLLRRVLVPAALPEIFTGLRVGFSVTLIGTLISEMFGSKRGLGFLLMNALGVHNMDLIMAITLMLVTFAAISNSILMSIENRLYHRS
jgi:NitT/TauT family transport system permease protein